MYLKLKRVELSSLCVIKVIGSFVYALAHNLVIKGTLSESRAYPYPKVSKEKSLLDVSTHFFKTYFERNV